LVGAKLDGCDLRETRMKKAIFSTGFLAPTPGDKCWQEWEDYLYAERTAGWC